MWSSVKNFISRHRRKFVATGVVVGGTYLAIRYVSYKLYQFQERQAREFLEKTRRTNHYESIEKTCNQTIIGLSPTVSEEIVKLLNTNEILERLRHSPDNKIELWEELKIYSFTKLTTLIYASSMLVVTLRIQLNLLGGYLYKDTVNSEQLISNEIREAYLSLVHHFIKDGMSNLVKMIEGKVNGILKAFPLNKKLTLSDVEQIFWQIQMAVNSDVQEPSSKIAYYVLPNESPETDILSKMHRETLDLLESDDVAVICSNNVSRGFSIAVDNIAENYSEVAQVNAARATNDSDKAGHSKVQLNSVLNINNIELPLAKLIPIVNDIATERFDSHSRPPNLATSLVTLFLASEKIKTLGANVYEVFSI